MGYANASEKSKQSAQATESAKTQASAKDSAVQQQNAETAFSEAVNEKNGEKALEVLQNASAEERKAISKNKTLMKAMKKNLDKKTVKACDKLLGNTFLGKAKSAVSSAKSAVSSAVNKGKEKVEDLVDAGKEKVEDLIDAGKEKVEDIKVAGKEKVDEALDWAKAFIPQNVSNETMVNAYKIMSKMDTSAVASKLGDDKVSSFIKNIILGNTSNTITKDEIAEHKKYNSEFLDPKKNPNNPLNMNPGDYIENQSKWEDVKFGKGRSNMEYSGCEIIATYNALVALGEKPSMPDLIEYYENGGMALDGQFGSSPDAICKYFKKTGRDATMITDFSSPDKIKFIADNYTTFIATVYNNANDNTSMIHTVSITKTGSGDDMRFVAHNTGIYTGNYNKDPDKDTRVFCATDGFKTLSQAMAAISGSSYGRDDNGKLYCAVPTAKPISLIGINGKSAE